MKKIFDFINSVQFNIGFFVGFSLGCLFLIFNLLF